MSDEKLSRRRFLKASSVAAGAAGLAGCGSPPGTDTGTGTDGSGGGGGDGSGGGDGGGDGTSTPEMQTEFDQYPYGYDSLQISEATQVMSDAGYGEDNRASVTLTIAPSQTWRQIANTLRDRLSAAYIDLNIEESQFSEIINRGQNGNLEAFQLGWIADYPAADNFLQLINPPNTNYNEEGSTGAYVFWNQGTGATEAASSAWQTVEDNPEPSDSAQQARNDAYVQLEEAMWAGVPLIPVIHGANEPMWYDRVDYQPHGSMGSSRQKKNRIGVQGQDSLNLINASITTFDPIASTDVAGGTVIMQVFDALVNYPDGEAAVENLLVESLETSDDFTTYTANLKSGVTFHDGSELTASDVVYAWRRLAESGNSRRASFILGTLGVTHETNDDGSVVPDSLGVTAVDDTTLEIEIEEPFASALSMMAYSAFSAVPEGIVGDIEGYDGDMSYNEFSTSNPVGCGPFTFDSWNQGSDVSVNAYDEYHGQSADVSSVNWAIIEESNAQYNYFMNQNADLAGIPTSQYDPELRTVDRTDDLGRQRGSYGPVRNGETLNWAKIPEISTFYLAFNCSSVERPVRQAFAHAMNQHQIANGSSFYKGRTVPAYHLTPPLIYPGGASAYDEHASGGN